MKNRENFGVLVTFAVVAVGVIALAFFTTSPEVAQPNKSAGTDGMFTTNRQGTSITTRADSDGDGIPNWKEVLLGTDPNNIDSDGDGISDGDEVARGSDPAVHGTELISEKPYVAPPGTEPTEALGKELFASYLSLKEDGEISEAELQAALESIVERNVLDIEPPQYTFEDIRLTHDEGKAALSAYADTVQQALAKGEAVTEHETVTMYKLLDTGDVIYIQKLESNAALYSTIIEDLLAIPAPPAIAATHLELLNSLSAATHSLTLLSINYKDPYQALLTLDAFVAAEERFIKAYNTFVSITTSS